ncbi:MAG: GGDEF domain-containing protein [Ruminococcus sp.]
MEILETFSTNHETQSDYQLTSQQAKEQMRFFRNVFTVVRLLKGEDLEGIRESTEDASFCECYDYWGKGQPCENCISMQTLRDRQQHTKLEFLGTDIYQVFSRYVEVDGKPCVMELIRKLDSDSLIGASERDKLIRQLSQYHVELYRDALTGAYNRRYLEDRSKQKKFTGGAAMIDLDDFKVYNDTCGHDPGIWCWKRWSGDTKL